MSALNRKEQSEVLFGNMLSEQVSMRFSKSHCGIIPGVSGAGTPCGLFLNQEAFSKHLLLIGGVGEGKTNTMFHLMDIVNRNLTDNDVAVIFDTKGDFYEKFYRPGDVVISSDETACDPSGEN